MKKQIKEVKEYNVKIFARKKNIDLRTSIYTETDGNWWSLEDLLNEFAMKFHKAKMKCEHCENKVDRLDICKECFKKKLNAPMI